MKIELYEDVDISELFLHLNNMNVYFVHAYTGGLCKDTIGFNGVWL